LRALRGEIYLFGRLSISRGLEAEKLDGVTADHFVFVRFRHAGEVFIDDLERVGPVGFLMREVGAPHEFVDADLVAQLDADAVELEAPQAMLANIFTRRPLQWIESQQALGPTMVTVVA